MEKLSIESIEGDNYLPLHGRNYKPKPRVREKEPEIHLPSEWDEAVNQANEKDLQELAGGFQLALYSAKFWSTSQILRRC